MSLDAMHVVDHGETLAALVDRIDEFVGVPEKDKFPGFNKAVVAPTIRKILKEIRDSAGNRPMH